MPDNLLKFLAEFPFIEAQTIFSWGMFAAVSGIYVFSNYTTDKSYRSDTSYTTYLYAWLIGATALFRFFISFLKTFTQYYVWEKNPIMKIFLSQPLDAKVPISKFISKIFFDNPHGSFFYYAWGHFFLNVFLSIFSAIAVYFLLVVLRKYRERFFEEGEIALGTLLALVVGWPNVVLFVPMALVLTVAFSLVRRIAWGEQYTKIGWSFLISGFAVLAFGKFLIDFFHLAP